MYRLSIFLLTSSSIYLSSSLRLSSGRIGWQATRSLIFPSSGQWGWSRLERKHLCVTTTKDKDYVDISDEYSRNCGYDDEDEEVPVVCGDNQNKRKKRASRKFRQHVNPLASGYQLPTHLNPDWIQRNYQTLSDPFIIDIGCSKGTWAIEMCKMNSNLNVLGLEIRKPVVEYALERRDKRSLSNLHFVQTNANVDIERIIKDIQKVSTIEMICVQFPDPHFKAKRKKRRVVNELFVKTLSNLLLKDTKIFLQSDVEEVITDMIESFLLFSSDFKIAPGYTNGPPQTLETNKSPTTVRTEREISVQNRNLPVYRMMFVKS